MGKILSIIGAVLFIGITFYPMGYGFSMFTALSMYLTTAGAAAIVIASGASTGLLFANKAKIGAFVGIIPVLLVLVLVIQSGGQALGHPVAIAWALGPFLQVAGGFMAAKSTAAA